MEQGKIVTPFFDLEKKGLRQTNFFFLEHVLKARADLKLESGQHEYDQEVNVYLAGLLHSLVESTSFLKQKPYISAFDTDIRKYLDSHPGTRNEYTVYRDNADFGLMLLGLFLGYEHQGSYHNIVLSKGDDQGKIAVYYELAGSALTHLQGKNSSLVYVFFALAESMPETLQILRRAAGSYFELIDRISDGSLYHLRNEIDTITTESKYNTRLDEFLKVYKQYKETPSNVLKESLLSISADLKKMNEHFKFDEKL